MKFYQARIDNKNIEAKKFIIGKMDPNQDKHMPELFKYPLNELPLSRDILSEDEIEKIKELLLIDKLSPSSLYYLFDSYWNPIKNIFSFETADDILHLEDLGVERLLLINEPENQSQIFTSCSLSQISRDNIFADKELGGLEFRSKPASKKIKGKLKLIDHLKISPNRNICNKFLHPNFIAEQADLATPYLKKVLLKSLQIPKKNKHVTLDFTVKGMQFSRNTAKQSDLHSPKKNRKVDFIKFKNTQRGPIQSLKIQKSYLKEGRVQSLTERKPNYLKYNNHLKKSIKDLLYNPPLKFNIEEYKTINPDQKKQNKLKFYKSSPKSKNNLENSKKKLSLSKNKIFQAHDPAGVIKGSLTERNNHNGKSLRDFEQSIKRHNTKRAKRIPNRVYEIIRLKVKSQRRRIDSKTAHFLKDHRMRYEQISSTIKNIKRG